jgi:division protein CdvB (Snf7/Vps24/ESCRT-III family)
MEDKKIKELQDWAENISNVIKEIPLDNFSNFVNDLSKDLTPEEKAMVDKEMDKINDQDLKENLDNLNKMIQEQMSKFKF